MKAARQASSLLGSHLRELREETGFTLRDVEQATRALSEPIAFDALSRIETGQSLVSPEKILVLSRVYHVPPQQFLDMLELEQLGAGRAAPADPETCMAEANAAREKGDLRETYATLRGGLVTLTARGIEGAADAEWAARFHINIGSTLRQMGKHRAAQSHYEQALEYRTLPERLTAMALTGLSGIAYQMDRLRAAEGLALAALKSARRTEEPHLIGLACLELSNILEDLGSNHSALRFIRSAVEHLDRAPRCPQQVTARYNLGLRLEALGDTPGADAAWDEGLAAAGTFGDPRLRIRGLFETGRAAFQRGDIPRAALRLRAGRDAAAARNLRAEQFHCAYFLWCLALRSGKADEARAWLAELKPLRLLLDQRTEELLAFDQFIHQTRARKRARRPP